MSKKNRTNNATETSKTDAIRAQREAKANDTPPAARSRKTRAAEAASKPIEIAAPSPEPVAPVAEPTPEPVAPAPAPAPAQVLPDNIDPKKADEKTIAAALKMREQTNRWAAEYDKKMREIGPAHQVAVLLNRMVERTTHWADKLAGNPETETAVECLRYATKQLQMASTNFASLPVGWKPAPKTATAAPKANGALAKGTKVSIREDQRKAYADVLDEDQLVNLTVEAAPAGGKVRCLTQSGTLVVLPRGHVCPAA